MYEVELKLPADHGRVRERLRELDATREGRRRQTDTYYDAPHRSFPETDEALRIRREESEGGTVTETLTYKGPLVDGASKTRRELETGIDAEAAAGILEALGFEPAAEVRKDRERYEFEGYTVTLDSVDGLGTYVEVERSADAGGIDEVREGAVSVLSELGLDPDDQLRASYLELLMADG